MNKYQQLDWQKELLSKLKSDEHDLQNNILSKMQFKQEQNYQFQETQDYMNWWNEYAGMDGMDGKEGDAKQDPKIGQIISQIIEYHQNDSMSYIQQHIGNQALETYYYPINQNLKLINSYVSNAFKSQVKINEEIVKNILQLFQKYLLKEMVQNQDDIVNIKNIKDKIKKQYMSNIKPYQRINKKIISTLFQNPKFMKNFGTFVERHLESLLKQKNNKKKEIFKNNIVKKIKKMKPHEIVIKQLPWKQSILNKTVQMAKILNRFYSIKQIQMNDPSQNDLIIECQNYLDCNILDDKKTTNFFQQKYG